MANPRSIIEAAAAMMNDKCDLSDVNWHPQFHMTPYGEQDDNGVDVSLIRANLRLLPRERIIQADRMRAAALRMRDNVRRIDAR